MSPNQLPIISTEYKKGRTSYHITAMSSEQATASISMKLLRLLCRDMEQIYQNDHEMLLSSGAEYQEN